jgi:6-pyruvoyltetrahydropterin/6-carboxytetrahydropterin synthase
MFELKIKDHIAAAHFLRGYEGMCKNLHGHTWQVEVALQAKDLDKIGMVVDFVVLKKKLKEFLSQLDHVCLNDLPYFKQANPTTEHLAQYIYHEFSKQIIPLIVSKVTVWESDNASVAYWE